MSIKANGRHSNSSAEVVLDELIAFGLIIIIFSASTVMCAKFNELYLDRVEADELYQKAVDISHALQNNEKLICNGRSAVFDVRKLSELESEDLEKLVMIPNKHGLIVNFEDISAEEDAFNLILSTQEEEGRSKEGDVGRAVVISAVNLQINELEVHAARLTVILWRWD